MKKANSIEIPPFGFGPHLIRFSKNVFCFVFFSFIQIAHGHAVGLEIVSRFLNPQILIFFLMKMKVVIYVLLSEHVHLTILKVALLALFYLIKQAWETTLLTYYLSTCLIDT